jgi:hypothetical protein
MKNTTKALLIPIAAFAVTVTGASAFNSSVLENAGLDTQQIAAFEQAHDLRKVGDKEAARDVLVEAGVDMDTMKEVREAMKEHRAEMHEAVEDAVKNGNYEAFLEAVAGSPVSEIVDTSEEFALFSQAFDLRESGDKQSAREIMEELGFEGKMHGKGHGMRGDHDGDFEGKRDGRFNGFRGQDSE